MVGTDVCVFGEVLFDHFPDGQRVLGGAPFNVAWHLQAFGLAPRFISRVGSDDEGAEIRASMQSWGMRLDGLQTDATLPSGRVTVALNDGQPSYEIVQPVAYDAIEPPDGGAQAGGCSLLYHGSLALRSEVSRRAFLQLADAGASQVFLDVNLRDPWWDADTVRSWMRRADWIKLNGDELARLVPSSQERPGDLAAVVSELELQGLIVTYGDKGAVLAAADGETVQTRPGERVPVVDTVGAGDAFASIVMLGLVRGWNHRDTLERAQNFASAIVGRRGATVDDTAFYRGFASRWDA